MHFRLAERRDLIQTERWKTLARSIAHTSDAVERILGDVDLITSRRLIARLCALRCHLSEHAYSREHLGAAVCMMNDVAGTLSRLVTELGLAAKPPESRESDRRGPP